MAALVLVPAHTPPLPDDAHLTLVWPGDTPAGSVLSALGIIGANFSRTTMAFAAKVNGIAFFGPNRNEPVMLCELTSELALLRAAVQQYSQSEHTEFRPHVAVAGMTPKLLNIKTRPRLLYFNRIALWPDQMGQHNAVTWWLGG
jgi:2'-5' RNA ligase